MVETARLLYLTSKGSNIAQKQSYGTVRNVLAANCSSAKYGCVISSTHLFKYTGQIGYYYELCRFYVN